MPKKELPQPQVKHESKLQIGNKEIRCYVLEDGRRVFNSEDFDNFFLGLSDIKANCAICDKELPEIVKTLLKIEAKNPTLFEALMKEKFICDVHEEEFEKQLLEKNGEK